MTLAITTTRKITSGESTVKLNKPVVQEPLLIMSGFSIFLFGNGIWVRHDVKPHCLNPNMQS